MFTESEDPALVDLLDGSRSRAQLLVALFRHPNEQMTKTDLADRAGVDKSTVHRHSALLEGLLEDGVLEITESDGHTEWFTVDMTHSFAQPGIQLVEVAENMRRRRQDDAGVISDFNE